MGRLFVLCLVYLAVAQMVAAQGTINTLRFGVYGNPQLNVHSVNFSNLSGSPNCCAQWKDDFQVGAGTGVTADMNFSNIFGISIRIGYATLGGTLKSNVYWGVIAQDEQLVKVYINRAMETDIAVLSFSPSASMVPWQSFPFRLTAGLIFDVPLRKSYTETEVLGFSPNYIPGTLIEPGEDKRQIGSGDIPEVPAILYGVQVGLQYDVSLNKSLNLTWYVLYAHRFTNLTSASWQIYSIIPGVSLSWRPFAPEN